MRRRYVVKYADGHESIQSQRLSGGIPCGMDSKVSPTHPEAWRCGMPEEAFPEGVEEIPGCEIVVQNIQKDHIHMIMIIAPRYAVSEAIGRIKCQTASQPREKFLWLDQVYWKENIVWSLGYFVSTIGVDEAKILKYVRWQQHQDEGQAKLELF